MTSPIVVFAQVIQYAVNGGALAFGRTFVTLFFIALPKGMFPWAPVALGYELVKITDPSRYGTGYSVASTAYGEWVYNFSLVQGSGHGVIFRVWSGPGFDLVAQDEIGAGVTRFGGGEVFTELGDGGGGTPGW
jgi:hypothetical protein